MGAALGGGVDPANSALNETTGKVKLNAQAGKKQPPRKLSITSASLTEEDIELTTQLNEASEQVKALEDKMAQMKAEHEAHMLQMTKSFITKLAGDSADEAPKPGDNF